MSDTEILQTTWKVHGVFFITIQNTKQFYSSSVIRRAMQRENMRDFCPNEEPMCSLKLGYVKAMLLVPLWVLCDGLMLVGQSQQGQWQRWDRKIVQLRRESWERWQKARKFLNFFSVNMKSDVMASIFMFTKNVGDRKMSFSKYYIFSSKKCNIFWDEISFLFFHTDFRLL